MAEPQRVQTAPLSVSQLSRYVGYLLEHDEFLMALSVQGEISEFTRSALGHIYFTLKDARSQLPCVLFAKDAARQRIDLRELRKGVAVVAEGSLTVYEPRGAYQLAVQQVRIQGDGTFAQRLEQLKARLEQEGLFAAERKRKLPKYPRLLALVTAPGSQAYHDVLHRLRHQYPLVRVVVAGVNVQGENAPGEMVYALQLVNRHTSADAILLVRGGGASEDLVAFNDERLARAIFASQIPVVTGIGHETDQTVADLVADVRAATPSLAAAAAVPDVAALVSQSSRLHANATQLLQARIRAGRQRLQDANRALVRTKPETRLSLRRQRVDELRLTADRTLQAHLRSRRARFAAARTHLDALDPLAILKRGYAVVSDPATGRVISQVEDAVPGMLLETAVSDGSFITRVEST